MVSGYFGVPGCGKTTILTAIAQKELRKIEKGISPYKHVLTNFYCEGCERIDFKDLSIYYITDSLILLDEITLDADSRDFKQFSQGLKDFFVLHRHVYNDIIYFCQDFSRVDKTIRNVTYDLWYVSKTVVPFFNRWSVAKQIYRNIDINEYSSELVLGYRFAKFTEVIFGKPKKLVYRPKWYKYFDSYDPMGLDLRPAFEYISWSSTDASGVFYVYCNDKIVFKSRSELECKGYATVLRDSYDNYVAQAKQEGVTVLPYEIYVVKSA